MTDNKNTKTVNANGLAIYEALKANEGKTLAFAEIANIANIAAKTGYLTSAKKIAKENGYKIVKVENAIAIETTSITKYPSGLEVEKTVTDNKDGYTLVPADEAADAEDAD